jgi:hypothetical protein
MLQATRSAMDSLPNGSELLLSTEGYSDLYSFYASTALVSWVGYPSKGEVSCGRVTAPWYVGNIYGGASTTVGRAAMDGWNQWNVDQPLEAAWNMLRESFGAIFATRPVTAVDPTVPNNPSFGLRMYDAGTFYLIVAAPGAAALAATDPTAAEAVAYAMLIKDSPEHTANFGSASRRHRQASAPALATSATAEFGILPPQQQGPICLQPCADITIHSRWVMINQGNVNGSMFALDTKGMGYDTLSRQTPQQQCLTIVSAHKIRSGGLELRPCNTAAPLQRFTLNSSGALETTATAAELASVGVGTRACQCQSGRFVDVNAHESVAGITLQMYGPSAHWHLINVTSSETNVAGYAPAVGANGVIQLQSISYGASNLCMASVALPPPPPSPPPPLPPGPVVVSLPVVVPAGTQGIEMTADGFITSNVIVDVESKVRLSGKFSVTVLSKSPSGDGTHMAPAVLVIQPVLTAQALTVKQGGTLNLQVEALPIISKQLGKGINVTVSTFGGLSTNMTELQLQPIGAVTISASTDLHPGPYLLRIGPSQGNDANVLPARRWIQVVPAQSSAV